MAFPTATVTQGAGLTVNTLPNAGQNTMANSLGVAIASDQSGVPVTATDGAIVTIGTQGDAAWSGSGSSTLVAALKAIYAKVAGIIGVSQSGTWTVQPGNTANTTAWKVDNSAVVQGTSAASGAFVDGSISTIGTQADAAWSGSGSSTLVAALKAIYAKVAATLTVSGTVVLGTGAAAIGYVIGRTSNPSVTPGVTAGAYTAGQEAGGLMAFAVGGAGSGILESIRVTCKSIQTTALKLYIFDTNPTNTTWTDKSTASINALDIPFLRGVFVLSGADSGLGTHTIWNLEAIGCSFVGANLYGVLVVVGTPTFASTTDITVKLGIVDD
jgi:hypothetical protein